MGQFFRLLCRGKKFRLNPKTMPINSSSGIMLDHDCEILELVLPQDLPDDIRRYAQIKFLIRTHSTLNIARTRIIDPICVRFYVF